MPAIDRSTADYSAERSFDVSDKLSCCLPRLGRGSRQRGQDGARERMVEENRGRVLGDDCRLLIVIVIETPFDYDYD